MPIVLKQIDKNHLIKIFDRLFKKFNTKFIERTKGTFTSVALHCCSDESHRIRKIERWMGAFDHYTSSITVQGQLNWVLKNNELSKEALKRF